MKIEAFLGITESQKRTKLKARNALKYLSTLEFNDIESLGSSLIHSPPPSYTGVEKTQLSTVSKAKSTIKSEKTKPLKKVVLKSVPKVKKSKSKKRSKLDEHIIKPVFGRFVTRNPDFAKELITLRALLLNYAERPANKRPMNLLLAAEPGAGKSFVVKELARSLPKNSEIQFDEYYIGALRSASELTAIFHRIQSANLKNKLPVVLFDEVDGKVGNDYLFAKFLAPMWDGFFHEGTESYPVGKAVLVFAASKLVPPPILEVVLTARQMNQASIGYHTFLKAWHKKVRSAVKRNADNMPKSLDFIDRIDYMLCIPPTNEKLIGKKESAQELTEIICLMVQKYFENVDKIQKSVIEALLNEMAESGSRRSVEKTIFCSTVDSSDFFSFENLPEHIQRIHHKKANVKNSMNKVLKFKVGKPIAIN